MVHAWLSWVSEPVHNVPVLFADVFHRKLLNDLAVVGDLPLPPVSTSSNEDIYIYRKPSINKFPSDPVIFHATASSQTSPVTVTSQINHSGPGWNFFPGEKSHLLPLSTDELRRLPIHTTLPVELASWPPPSLSNVLSSFVGDASTFPFNMTTDTDHHMPSQTPYYENIHLINKQTGSLPVSFPALHTTGTEDNTVTESCSMWVPSISTDSFA